MEEEKLTIISRGEKYFIEIPSSSKITLIREKIKEAGLANNDEFDLYKAHSRVKKKTG